ncbi:MAG TPA: hypothetical protein VGN80_19330 [Devosiaceae bacterium]|jgi:hypothetical protein|nr:hypothetical protein [Devosiaceae bacterium]
MLAGQALSRWSFRLAELQQLAGATSAEEQELLLVETNLGVQQMASLAERMQTFSRSTILPVRFQAQEMLVAVARIKEQLLQVQRQMDGQAPVRPAGEIAAALLGRAKRGGRSRSGHGHRRRESAPAASG